MIVPLALSESEAEPGVPLNLSRPRSPSILIASPVAGHIAFAGPRSARVSCGLAACRRKIASSCHEFANPTPPGRTRCLPAHLTHLTSERVPRTARSRPTRAKADRPSLRTQRRSDAATHLAFIGASKRGGRHPRGRAPVGWTSARSRTRPGRARRGRPARFRRSR
jgi:hypothetical protein